MQYAGYPQAAARFAGNGGNAVFSCWKNTENIGTLEKNQDYGILRPFAQNRKGEEA